MLGSMVPRCERMVVGNGFNLVSELSDFAWLGKVEIPGGGGGVSEVVAAASSTSEGSW